MDELVEQQTNGGAEKVGDESQAFCIVVSGAMGGCLHAELSSHTSRHNISIVLRTTFENIKLVLLASSICLKIIYLASTESYQFLTHLVKYHSLLLSVSESPLLHPCLFTGAILEELLSPIHGSVNIFRLRLPSR